MMQLVPFPARWLGDALLGEIEAGMRRGTVTSTAAHDTRRRHLGRRAAAACVAALPDRARRVYLMCEGPAGVSPDTNWTLSIGAEAEDDEGLAEWCDPYRIGRALMRLRAERRYAEADALRRDIAGYWRADVRVECDALVITTAERGYY